MVPPLAALVTFPVYGIPLHDVDIDVNSGENAMDLSA
jgi:hypothetical protein